VYYYLRLLFTISITVSVFRITSLILCHRNYTLDDCGSPKNETGTTILPPSCSSFPVRTTLNSPPSLQSTREFATMVSSRTALAPSPSTRRRNVGISLFLLSPLELGLRIYGQLSLYSPGNVNTKNRHSFHVFSYGIRRKY
jgi:hypothetical protein